MILLFVCFVLLPIADKKVISAIDNAKLYTICEITLPNYVNFR